MITIYSLLKSIESAPFDCRMLVQRPSINYASVGYKEQIFFAASPLFQFNKRTNVINALWRAVLNTSTFGAAGVCNATGISETFAGSFSRLKSMVKEIAKSERLE